MSLRFKALDVVNVTESGIAYNGRCYFAGFFLGTDTVNDPIITIYDNITNSGTELIPTNTYSARVKGMNGVEIGGSLINAYKGIYVEITCSGEVEVVVLYRAF